MAMENHSESKRPLWGILGGMGPLASAKFLSTIYEHSLGRKEQKMPRVVLLSDPTVPDRTTAIQKRQPQEVAQCLQRLLDDLKKVGPDRIAIACITAHYFLSSVELPSDIPMTSLLDVVFKALLTDHRKYLLLCTSGTREGGIFQSHSDWAKLEGKRVELPQPCDQCAVHDYLYEIKRSNIPLDLKLLRSLQETYEVDGFIAGCTEIHLHSQAMISAGMRVIDPLLILAQEIAES